MKRLIQRIKIFWVLYFILFALVLVIVSFFIYGMENQESGELLMLIMVLVLIALSVLTLALPDNNIMFRCLLRLAQRIRIFWGMYVMYILVLIVALFSGNLNIVIITSIILAVLTILSIILPEDNGFFKVLLVVAKYSVSMVVDAFYEHSYITKDKRLVCRKCGSVYPRNHKSRKCDRCESQLYWN